MLPGREEAGMPESDFSADSCGAFTLAPMPPVAREGGWYPSCWLAARESFRYCSISAVELNFFSSAGTEGAGESVLMHPAATTAMKMNMEQSITEVSFGDIISR